MVEFMFFCSGLLHLFPHSHTITHFRTAPLPLPQSRGCEELSTYLPTPIRASKP
jgi:hypothetical protein